MRKIGQAFAQEISIGYTVVTTFAVLLVVQYFGGGLSNFADQMTGGNIFMIGVAVVVVVVIVISAFALYKKLDAGPSQM